MEENFYVKETYQSDENQNAQHMENEFDIQNRQSESTSESDYYLNENSDASQTIQDFEHNSGFVSGADNFTAESQSENALSGAQNSETQPLSSSENPNFPENVLTKIKDFFSSSFARSTDTEIKNNLYTADECVLVSSQNTTIYKYKNGFVFSNTVSLLLVAIFVFLYVKNTASSRMKNLCKSEKIWLLFGLFLISFYASSTNFPLKFVNDYKTAVYVNQVLLFLSGLAFFRCIINKKEA